MSVPLPTPSDSNKTCDGPNALTSTTVLKESVRKLAQEAKNVTLGASQHNRSNIPNHNIKINAVRNTAIQMTEK